MTQTIQIPVSNRSKVLKELRQKGFSESLLQWTVSNLVPSQVAAPGQAAQALVWAFDVQGAADLYEDYKQVDAWSLLCALLLLQLLFTVFTTCTAYCILP